MPTKIELPDRFAAVFDEVIERYTKAPADPILSYLDAAEWGVPPALATLLRVAERMKHLQGLYRERGENGSARRGEGIRATLLDLIILLGVAVTLLDEEARRGGLTPRQARGREVMPAPEVVVFVPDEDALAEGAAIAAAELDARGRG